METSLKQAVEVLITARLVFWDFDGVIKDSVEVKTAAFEEMFLPYGVKIAAKIRAHHEAHGGVSRLQKIPLYLGWAGVSATPAIVDDYCHRFSGLVRQRVIDAPWVPGVLDYLLAHHARQCFVLVTATPQAEIEHIVDRLGIARLFGQVFGAPTKKAEAIAQVLAATGTEPRSALMVGDAETDLAAAAANGIGFLLRRTALNRALHDRNEIAMFDHLAS